MTPTDRPAADAVSRYTPPPIAGDFRGKHIVTVDQFDRHDLDLLMQAAGTLRTRVLRQDPALPVLGAGTVMASLFFEASTRTDLSFQAAMLRLGGEVVGASNGVQFSSVYKGENLADTVRAAACYADVLVLRHPDRGSSYEAAYYVDLLRQQLVRTPVVISAGDGIGEHPTQALLDLYTILDLKGTLDGLTITLVGDLRNGRTVHSLAKLVARYGARDARVLFVSPPSLRVPASILADLAGAGIATDETDDLGAVLPHSDIIYWTRVQQERFDDPAAYDAIRDTFIMTRDVLAAAKPDAVLLHPLPRKHEMGTQADHDALDADPRAAYFRQMENGMFVRMALLGAVLGAPGVLPLPPRRA